MTEELIELGFSCFEIEVASAIRRIQKRLEVIEIMLVVLLVIFLITNIYLLIMVSKL